MVVGLKGTSTTTCFYEALSTGLPRRVMHPEPARGLRSHAVRARQENMNSTEPKDLPPTLNTILQLRNKLAALPTLNTTGMELQRP